MSGKFMRTKKFAISTITVLLIASQLCGCAATSQSEMLDMINRQETIVIEIAEPISVEQGEEKPIEWLELASLTTYQDFRNLFDDTLGITPHGTNGKNGIVYVDLAGNHTNNSTLRYAFANQKFIDTFWNNSDALEAINNSVKGVYVDVTTDKEARLASINAYFNIFADAEPNYFNGGMTLSRAEFYSGVYRASNPVSEIASTPDFLSAVGALENAEFASELNKQGVLYLDTNSQNLNASNFGGTITRAEAIYTLVKMYYNDEFEAITGKENCYSDATNGGDIASKQKFIETNKETGTVDYKTYWKSYELSYALQNPDKGLPTDLYKALVVANNHNLINGTESRWDEGLVKSEALDLITRVYEDLGATINVSRGNSTGEVIENEQPEVDKPSILIDTENSDKENITDNTSSEDSTELLLSEHITIINEKTGASTITEELAEKFREYTIFAGMTKEEIESYINNDLELRTDMAIAVMGKEHEHFIYESIEERSAKVDTLEDTTAGNGGGGASVPKPTQKPSSSEPVKEENYITPEAPSQTPNPYEQVMELEDGGDGGELVDNPIILDWN